MSNIHDLSYENNQAPMPKDPEFSYEFENFFHPFVGELIQKLNTTSLSEMLDPRFLDKLRKDHLPSGVSETETDFFKLYEGYYSKQDVLVEGHPRKIDLSFGGPYANYNWELCFHIPLVVAAHLSNNQRFQEAERWFHAFLFDPTCNDTSLPPDKRCWKFLGFRTEDAGDDIDEVIRILSTPDKDLSSTDLEKKPIILEGYHDLLKKPFQPYVVARTRLKAHQYHVLMKYLDNKLAWSATLARQETAESVNEALMHLVQAANILGRRPQRIPPRGTMRPKTFHDLKNKELGPLGNLFEELEGKFVFNWLPNNKSGSYTADSLFGIGEALYFCLPPNEKLLAYWDIVADRLFKIRHCMNLEGVVRQLPLFDPPIDPGMLVKAAAIGIDIGSIVSGLNQPVGPLRSPLLIQKALEICGEVRSLGASLLAAIEKGDAEHLTLMRQRHELSLQQATQDLRFLQWKQAQETTESLLRTRASTLGRYRFYQRLLGIEGGNTNVLDVLALDHHELTEENFDETYKSLVDQYGKAVPEQGYPNLVRAPEEEANLIALALQTGNLHLNLYEYMDLNVLGPAALILRVLSAASDAATTVLAALPDSHVDVHYWGIGGHATVAGGSKLADSGQAASEALKTLASISEFAASYTAKTAGYQRRSDEWILQHNQAARELMQIGRQIIGSLISEQVAYHEYLIHKKQIENTQEVNQFLQDKFTNEDLYIWMQSEISRLYYEYYRFAFDIARKAEKTMKQELMRPEVDAQDFVKFNYWDGGRKGLLSGEALYLDVKRMEMAYHENNKRELELAKHVSLRQLNPIALLTLKATGSCQVTIPEWLYDLDCPGHYMRRIKSVAISIPAVAGPYTSVNCTLSLLKSSLRKSYLPKDGQYERDTSEDERFVDYVGLVQSIVTSTGQNDSGMFETNLRDERFLPFEGAGAESTWKLDLPKDYRAFDYDTISDIILHIRYTARQGVNPTIVKAAMDQLFQDASESNLSLLFSLRHDFPNEWSAFVNSTTKAPFTTTIRKDYFPYFTQGRTIAITRLEVFDGENITKHKPIDDPIATPDSPIDLTDAEPNITFQQGSNEILTRKADAEVFLVLHYTIE